MRVSASVLVAAGLTMAGCAVSDSSPAGEPDVAAATQAVTLSSSKLGVQILGDRNTPADKAMAAVCPRVVKFFVPDGGVADRIRAYKTQCPGGTVIVRELVPRVDVGGPYYARASWPDPIAAADHFWWNFVFQDLSHSGIDKSLVNWVEPENELDHIDNWYGSTTAAQWGAQFFGRLAEQLHVDGWNPMIGSIATGNPALNSDIGGGGAIKPLLDVLKSKSYRIGWSYHAYGNSISEGDPSWTLYRYRKMIADNPDLKNYSLVLSEGGLDSPGWQQQGITGDQYLTWLKGVDAQIKNDASVVGMTLFILSDGPQFKPWAVDPIASSLATYINGGSAGGPPGCGRLASGGALGRGQAMPSCNGKINLVHQTDGNVVLYDRLGALWNTRTAGQATTWFVMQTDGNLVLYSTSGAALWNSGTGGRGPASLVLQDDCNMVVYDNAGHALWNTRTAGCR